MPYALCLSAMYLITVCQSALRQSAMCHSAMCLIALLPYCLVALMPRCLVALLPYCQSAICFATYQSATRLATGFALVPHARAPCANVPVPECRKSYALCLSAMCQSVICQSAMCQSATCQIALSQSAKCQSAKCQSAVCQSAMCQRAKCQSAMCQLCECHVPERFGAALLQPNLCCSRASDNCPVTCSAHDAERCNTERLSRRCCVSRCPLRQ